ncbi:MAG: hypothetical protein LUQ07_07625 [Methanospirillum sp.]|nr:hypothetical protein [Methanospirillum sp.]
MNRIIKICLYAVIGWLVPFLVAIPFYTSNGQLLVDYALFKNVMVITGGLIGAFLLIQLFKTFTGNYIREAILIGVIWLIINWGLDLVILLPMNGMNPGEYFSRIGLGYLIIPIMCIMGGCIANNMVSLHSSH